MTTRTETPTAPTRSRVAAASAYRPDVDGLRAIAVTAVVAFHAGLSALPGGYVGVDVFFVISGYLITRQVVLSVQRGSFSFTEFYTRRIRRLMPAALTTIVLTLVASALLLPAFRLADVAASAAAAAVSLSNVFFWRSSSYWADEAAVQPLLHTWSLSVEEQFYLVWPLIIVLLMRWLPKRVLPILIAGTVASVAITTWATAQSPDAAFYLTPLRTYEFAIGALCVWAERLKPLHSERSGWVRATLWVAGVALILYAVLTFDEAGTAFPSWYALVPTVGAAFVICARRPAVLDRALDNPVALYIGLRSYSIYLVHWPVLVIAEAVVGPLTLIPVLGCVALTVVLAELQYRFIERPLRVHSVQRDSDDVKPTRATTPRARFLRLAAPVLVIAVIVVGAGGATWAYARSPLVYPEAVRAVTQLDREALNEVRRAPIGALCGIRDEGSVCGALSDSAPNVLVIGDSFGADGLNIARGIAPRANFLISEKAACPPIRLREGEGNADCAAFSRGRLDSIRELAPQVDLVVLSMKFTANNRERALDTVSELVALGVPVAVIGQGAHYDQEAWQTVVAHGRLDGLEQALHDHLDVTAGENDELAAAVEAAGAAYVDRWDWMCDGDGCKAYLDGDVADLVMYDTAHMTANGAKALVEAIRDDAAVQAAFAPALAD